MKRKRSLSDVSQSKALSLGRKSATEATSWPNGTSNTGVDPLPKSLPHLLQILTQYGILECLATHLFAKDILSLARTAKAAHQAILCSRESRLNLLKKTSCDGIGVRIRQVSHRKSKFFYAFDCRDNTRCGAAQEPPNSEMYPCVSCGVTTCQECRTHCVYQSHYQLADEEDELPCFSGFVLLDEHEMAILSPEHLRESGSWTTTVSLPHHDQGFLDSPLDSGAFSSIELIDEIIDTNLGDGELKGTNWSGSPHPSAVVQAFWKVSERRKRNLCKGCFEDTMLAACPSQGPCCCTLRSHFLDRWLCLRCYQREEKSIETTTYGLRINGCTVGDSQQQQLCPCGQDIATDSRVLCLWCMGEVGIGNADRNDASTKTQLNELAPREQWHTRATV